LGQEGQEERCESRKIRKQNQKNKERRKAAPEKESWTEMDGQEIWEKDCTRQQADMSGRLEHGWGINKVLIRELVRVFGCKKIAPGFLSREHLFFL